MLKIFAVSAAFVVGVSANASDRLLPYAETASAIAIAIEAGEDVTQVEGMFDLPALDKAEVAKLAGCDGFVQPGGSRKAVLIDWTCGEGTSILGLSRSTVMLFDRMGELYGFSVNSVLTRFEPTITAAAAVERPSSYRVARLFGEAVKAGEDATLNGYIPLSEYDLARLAQFEDGSIRVSRAWVGNTRKVHLARPGSSRNNRVTASIYFDEADRPIGLILPPHYNPDWKRTLGRDVTALTRDKNPF